MICRNCKNSISDDSNVCECCGTRIRDLNGKLLESQPKDENINNIGMEIPQGQQQNTYNGNTNVLSKPQNNGFNEEEHVSMWQWVGIMAINLIPCVGPVIYLVMMFVWGFGDNSKYSLKTYARATLIMEAISIVIAAIIIGIVATTVIGGGIIATNLH